MTKATGFTKALPKNFKKVKSGYDQAFTLPKGTSAAPIKQAKKFKKSRKGDAFVAGATGAAVHGAVTAELKKDKKKKNTEGRIRKAGGGSTNLFEELGRVEAEPSNRNRRAEVSRIHGELNKGYAKGGRSGYNSGGAVLKGKKVGCQIK